MDTEPDGLSRALIRSPSDRPIRRRLFLKGCFAAALAPYLPGCGGDPTGPGPGAPPWKLTVAPGEPDVEPSRGRSALGLGDERDGWLYVPTGYDPAVPAPLFVALHGFGGDAENWVSYPDRAERRGLVVMALDSRAATWDLLRDGYGPDVRFLDRALRHTFERCRIDPERMAIGGFSDGASYALSLGLANAALFSHVVAYSPGFYVKPGSVTARSRVFISHGDADGVIPVGASRDVIAPRLEEDGYDVTYVEFEGGHGVPSEISARALDWFLGVEGNAASAAPPCA